MKWIAFTPETVLPENRKLLLRTPSFDGEWDYSIGELLDQKEQTIMGDEGIVYTFPDFSDYCIIE